MRVSATSLCLFSPALSLFSLSLSATERRRAKMKSVPSKIMSAVSGSRTRTPRAAAGQTPAWRCGSVMPCWISYRSPAGCSRRLILVAHLAWPCLRPHPRQPRKQQGVEVSCPWKDACPRRQRGPQHSAQAPDRACPTPGIHALFHLLHWEASSAWCPGTSPGFTCTTHIC